jgi:hypothetical protein
MKVLLVVHALTAETGYGEMGAGGKQHGAQLEARESHGILKVEWQLNEGR